MCVHHNIHSHHQKHTFTHHTSQHSCITTFIHHNIYTYMCTSQRSYTTAYMHTSTTHTYHIIHHNIHISQHSCITTFIHHNIHAFTHTHAHEHTQSQRRGGERGKQTMRRSSSDGFSYDTARLGPAPTPPATRPAPKSPASRLIMEGSMADRGQLQEPHPNRHTQTLLSALPLSLCGCGCG